MAGKQKNLLERRKIPIYLALIGIVMMGLLAVKWGVTSEAEGEGGTTNGRNTDYCFSIGTKDYSDGDTYQMQTTEAEIRVKKKSSGGEVTVPINWGMSSVTANYVHYALCNYVFYRKIQWWVFHSIIS